MEEDVATEERIEERISERAYELYLARGAVAGREKEDWFQAEREILMGERRRRPQDEDTLSAVVLADGIPLQDRQDGPIAVVDRGGTGGRKDGSSNGKRQASRLRG